MSLSAAAAEPHRSWSGIFALLAAVGLFRLGTWVWTNVIKNPSPTPALPTAERVKAKATVGVTPDDTDDTERGEVGWWGRIREVGGVRFRQAQQVITTGSHVLPEDEPEDDEDGIDVPLDDEDEQDQGEPVEGYIAKARDAGVPYVHIVKVVEEHYGLTRDQAKYQIRKHDSARRPAA